MEDLDGRALTIVPVPPTAVALAGPHWIATARTDALEIHCDPSSVLEAVELRATCSEGVLGLAGMTAVSTP